jgi:hypothetical protein
MGASQLSSYRITVRAPVNDYNFLARLPESLIAPSPVAVLGPQIPDAPGIAVAAANISVHRDIVLVLSLLLNFVWLFCWLRTVYLSSSSNARCGPRDMIMAPGTQKLEAGDINPASDDICDPSNMYLEPIFSVKPAESLAAERVMATVNVNTREELDDSLPQRSLSVTPAAAVVVTPHAEVQSAQSAASDVVFSGTTYGSRPNFAIQLDSSNNLTVQHIQRVHLDSDRNETVTIAQPAMIVQQADSEQSTATEPPSDDAWYLYTNVQQRIQHCKSHMATYSINIKTHLLKGTN